ncbi:hypothetical protein GR11A_00027 [Vibrio phage vB_VcorM_GR11A]|nr:hypothetical protein GR11A_00027 [Vibrio phage vB_VcorM_GR11A]
MAAVRMEIYIDNELKYSDVRETDANGDVNVDIPANTLLPSLIPYTVVFTEVNTANYVTKTIYVMSPVMVKALQEIRNHIDRLNRKLRLDSLEFSDADYLQWLKTGMDWYNGAEYPTLITMTGARGPIYNFWMMYSQLVALRTRYLEEGLTSFDYGGAAITLTVDVTQFLESQAQFIETQIDKGINRHKAYLSKKGMTTGDGANFKGFVQGSTGYTQSPLIWGGNLLGANHPNKMLN